MRNGGLVAKKPCRICRKFYRPNARVGDRQKTCGREGCRKAWRSHKNREAYRRSRDYHRGQALRKKLEFEKSQPENTQQPSATPKRRPGNALQLPREDIQEAMSVEAMVILEYLVTLIFRRAREHHFL